METYPLSLKIGGDTAPISERGITQYFKAARFSQLPTFSIEDKEFFRKFYHLGHNGGVVFRRYTTDDPTTFKRCIQWLGFESSLNSVALDDWPQGQKYGDQLGTRQYAVGALFYALLNNKSLGYLASDGSCNLTEFDEDFNSGAKLNGFFERLSSFWLDGDLAELALKGTLHRKWESSEAATKEMAGEFVEGLFERRYSDFRIFRSTVSWSRYAPLDFIAYFIFDARNGEVWFFATEDFS